MKQIKQVVIYFTDGTYQIVEGATPLPQPYTGKRGAKEYEPFDEPYQPFKPGEIGKWPFPPGDIGTSIVD